MALRIAPDQMASVSEPTVLPEESVEPITTPEYGGGQVEQSIARYFAPEFMCGNCIHYMEPNACQIVAGEISPEGICSLHTPDAGAMSQPDEEPMQEMPMMEETEE